MRVKIGFAKLFSNALKYSFLIALSVIIVLPIFYSLMGSLKSSMEFLTGNRIIPRHFVWDNYLKAFKGAKFSAYTFNSIFISTISTIGSLLNVCIVGYCMARVNFIGKKYLRLLILSTIFIALGPMTLYPKILVVKALGIITSIWAIILGLMTAAGPQVFIFEAYFKSQGAEIDEAAVIDGCGLFRRFFMIGLPLAKPLLGTFAVMFFNESWNNFFWPYVLTFNNSRIQPLIVAVIALKDTVGESATEWGLFMAGASIAIIPVLIVYVFTSKWVIAGVTEGAVKM